MKVGIKKLQENEWLVHMGCAAVKMDRFSVELLNINLEHLLALEHGQKHDAIDGYVKLALRLKDLSGEDLQKLIRAVDNADLLVLMQTAQDETLVNRVLDNIGGIMSKQLEADLEKAMMPMQEDAMKSIRNVTEVMFEMEGKGEIEFISDDTEFV